MQCPAPSPFLFLALALIGGLIGWAIAYFTSPSRKRPRLGPLTPDGRSISREEVDRLYRKTFGN